MFSIRGNGAGATSMRKGGAAEAGQMCEVSEGELLRP